MTTVKTIGEVAKAGVDVRNFIQGNGYLPELITINGLQVNRASFLRMVCASIIEINTGRMRNILTDPYPNPSQKTDNVQDKAQLMKQDYIQLATAINTFIKGNGYAPELYTTRYGQLSFYGVIWTLSRVLAFYKENNYLPNYVVLENRFKTNKGPIQNACEKLLGTFTTFTEFYNKCKGRGYGSYYNDVKTLAQEYNTIANLNCADASQLAYNLAKEMGYNVRYCHVYCTQSGSGHIYLQVAGKELGSNWVKVDMAACMSVGSQYPIGQVWCSDAKISSYDDQWLMSDDGKT
jgi:hypothetical protein